MHVVCPYRVCPLGAHVDHQLGVITGFAIDKGVHFEFEPTNDGRVLLTSNDFKGIVSFDVNGFLDIKEDWGNYMRGATKILRDSYKIKKGVEGSFLGELPIGGLSSSAAVTLCYLKALCQVNEIVLTNTQLIDFAYRAEAEFIGLKIGKLDQSCEVLCKKNHFLYLDTKDMSYSLIPENKNHTPYAFLIVYSGQARSLVNSAYNVRVDECKSAAYFTKATLKVEYGKYVDTYLRDITFDQLKKCKATMPINWYKRAEHYFTETERVFKGVEAWKNGDMVEFGKLIKESGESSINLYEAGSVLLKDLNRIINQTDGVYGGRFMGGGFNGCCLAVIDPSKKENVKKEITEKYLELHPEKKDSYEIFTCASSDGIGE